MCRFIRPVSLAFSVIALTFVMPFLSNAQSPNDSKDVTALLSEVKKEASQLLHDADELKAFTRSKLTWSSHSAQVMAMKEHVNDSGKLLTRLNDTKSTASAWQLQAIDRITPILRELASSLEATITHLNTNPSRFHSKPYVEYVAANYDHASSLAALVSDYVEYGESKARSEQLASRLSTPGS